MAIDRAFECSVPPSAANTFFPSPLPQFVRLLVSSLLFVTVFASLNCAPLLFAQAPTLSQMVHVSWTARDGAPQGIKALAQAPDGTLWIGSDGGLFNFDGVTFQAFEPASGEPALPSNGVTSLCARPDGTLWVGMGGGGVARIVRGHLTVYTTADDHPLLFAQHLQPASDGSVWALSGQKELVRFGRDGSWHQERTPLGAAGGRITGYMIDRSGTLWVPQGGHLYRRAVDQSAYAETSVSMDWMFAATEVPDGSIWMTDVISAVDRGRTQHFDHEGKLIASLPLAEEMNSILYAPDGSLWLATQFEGLHRLEGDELFPHSALPVRAASVRAANDRYSHRDGLSSDSLAMILLDADGNIWTGSNRGIDRFTQAILKPFNTDKREGTWSLCSDSSGSIWIGSSRNRLFKVSGNTTQQFTHVGDIYSTNCGTQGNVWFVDHAGLWNMHNNRFTHIPLMPGAPPYAIRQVAEARDGALFVSTGNSVPGFWIYSNGGWRTLIARSPLSHSPAAQFVDSHNRLWTGYSDGCIGLPMLGGGQILSTGKPGLGLVRAFLESTLGIFAAGMNGIALFRGEQFHLLTFSDQVATRGVTGIVQSLSGDVWLNGSRGIVRIPSKELRAWLDNPGYRIKSEVFTEGDFTGPAPLLRGYPSAARDAEGKLWFSMLGGVVSVDPEHLYRQSHLPLLSIRSVTADGIPLGPGESIPPKPQTLLIHYFGVNLTAPEKVIYRYKLEGLDDSWQDVGHRTEAIYTHLRPGKYTFRVMASNGGGAWTNPVSSASFVVPPSFFETWWFTALCSLSALLLLWLLLSMRVRYVASIIKARAEERADERVHIARDLHDTLLQGVQGLLLTFHVAAQKVPPQDESRQLLEKALATADKIIIEGRNRVNRLRSEHLTDGELATQLQRLGADLALDGRVQFRVRRVGMAAVLQPHVVDEIFYIAREALTNAFRHSEATEIEVLLDYQQRCFLMSCTDNGSGFDEQRGKDASKRGHWGLRGMAERAEKIGGQFLCRSSHLGTQISLSVPSRRAYLSRPWLAMMRSRLFSRKDKICEVPGVLGERGDGTMPLFGRKDG